MGTPEGLDKPGPPWGVGRSNPPRDNKGYFASVSGHGAAEATARGIWQGEANTFVCLVRALGSTQVGGSGKEIRHTECLRQGREHPHLACRLSVWASSLSPANLPQGPSLAPVQEKPWCCVGPPGKKKGMAETKPCNWVL